MANLKSRTLTGLPGHIYDETGSPGITAVTRSGAFAGVFISPGALDPKLAQRFHQVLRHNPKHGVQLLLDYIKLNA